MAKEFLTGNEAFAHAALEAGVRVCAGYPGTPSSEVIETVAKEHAAGRAEGVHVEWSTNEKAALELLAGAAYSGARTLYTCKQVGLNVASDALMSLNYVGVKGGTVLYVADDPGPISSQTEQDTRRFAAFAKVPVFDPATPEQGCQMMGAAYDLSEKYQTPVLMRPTTRVCHASTYFEVAERAQARIAGKVSSGEVRVGLFSRSAPTLRIRKSTSAWQPSQMIFPRANSTSSTPCSAKAKMPSSALSPAAFRMRTRERRCACWKRKSRPASLCGRRVLPRRRFSRRSAKAATAPWAVPLMARRWRLFLHIASCRLARRIRSLRSAPCVLPRV